MSLLSDKWRPDVSVRRFVEWLEAKSVTDILGLPLEIVDPFETQFDEVEPARYYKSTPVDVPDPGDGRLRVMTWNIKFGGGRIDFWYDAHGDRVVMEDWEVLENLEGIAEKLRHADPDVLLIQEVDVDSHRTARIDQMEWLLEHTPLNFGAYASQWRATFVPVRKLGHVDMGIAILSKYPIADAQRIALPEASRDRITRYFYLKRAMLTARIDVPGFESLQFVNVHTEAFSEDGTKRRQIEHFKAELDRIDRAGGFFVAGGDLNTIPPKSDVRHGFPDLASAPEAFFDGGDFRDEEGWLAPLYEAYQSAVPLSAYREDNRPFCTYSGRADVFWCRKLDYLFTNESFVEGSTVTHQDANRGGMETMGLSDHAPVSAAIQLAGGDES